MSVSWRRWRDCPRRTFIIISQFISSFHVHVSLVNGHSMRPWCLLLTWTWRFDVNQSSSLRKSEDVFLAPCINGNGTYLAMESSFYLSITCSLSSMTFVNSAREFRVVNASFVVSIAPVFAKDPLAGVAELLDSMVMRFVWHCFPSKIFP
jgi:hypothetical protein